MTRAALLAPLALLGLVALAPAAAAQKRPPNAPEACPYCMGDPEVMAPAGVVSHGGFEFGRSTTEGVDAFLANCDIRWIETAHFEVGFAGAPYRIKTDEKKGFAKEFERLAALLPEVPTKPKVIDPWLRAHLLAMRLEDLYAEFLTLVQVDQAAFPDGVTQWDGRGDYMGEGPHMGQRGKYEVLILPGKGDQVAYLSEHFGINDEVTNRWNVVERDSLALTMNLRYAKLSEDSALHAHLAFNIAHNLLDGFRHYSYDTPIWIHEGLAHWFGRRINPEFNSFDGGEGGVGVRSNKSDWDKAVAAMVRGGDATNLAKLMSRRTYTELTLEDHFTCWSMTKYLLEEHPDAWAKLQWAIHGRLGEDGLQDSSNLNDATREAFKEHLGMNYLQFDEAWREWVLNPPLKGEDGEADEG